MKRDRKLILSALASARWRSTLNPAPMPIVTDNSGVLWLEPQHLDMRTVAKELGSGLTPSELRAKYSISDSDWTAFADALGKLWRAEAAKQSTAADAERLAIVNQKLAPLAFALPGYVTVAELGKTEALVNASPLDQAAVESEVLALAINPHLRSVQLHGRFLAVPLFQEFAYIIDSATFAYYRGNIVAAFFAIIPVIEGVLLRWQGFPGTVGKKPSFRDAVQFLKQSPDRQPLPCLPLFFDSWVTAASAIIQDHLYRPTTAGAAFSLFNRHLALHLLDDQRFCTPKNTQRAFLLLDLLSDIYVSEKRNDPRFDCDGQAIAKHNAAYVRAIKTSFLANEPEHLLYKTHPKCKFN